MDFAHTSVLLEECLTQLKIRPDGIYVDGTLGGAGHAKEVCKRLNDKGCFYGFDQDKTAIEVSTNRLAEFGQKVHVIKSNYENMSRLLKEQGVSGVDGILLDLGVSSYQLDTVERGFSYREDAPLDMRMDTESEFTAKDIVNSYEEKELKRILYEYGEEKFAPLIARAIVNKRNEHEIETTGQLVKIIDEALPAKAKKKKGHPAKKTFQAIRIELNSELDVLKNSLNDMIDLLNDDGRICVITFHSLEDRIVKNIFRTCENPCTCPPDFPVCVCGKVSQGKVITRKPILPSDEEMAVNSRSKSAKLRVFEKHKKGED